MANPTTAQVQAILNAKGHVAIGGVLYSATHGTPVAPSQATIDAVYTAMALVHQHKPLQGN